MFIVIRQKRNDVTIRDYVDHRQALGDMSASPPVTEATIDELFLETTRSYEGTMLTIKDLPTRCRRHTPPDVFTVKSENRDVTERLMWVVANTGSLGCFRSYNEALVAIAQSIHEKPYRRWENFRIEGHVPSWTVGVPDVIRAFERDGTAYIPDICSIETMAYRRSSRLRHA